MNNLKIGIFLLQLREEKALTQEEVANFIGVSNRAVSKWETGEGLPNYQALLALSSLYGVTINEILNGERATPKIEEKPEAKVSNSDEKHYWVNLILNIVAIAFFAVGIAVFLITNLAGNMIPGVITLGSLFPAGAICYGCSFIIKKRPRGLMVANNVLVYIGFVFLVLGLSSAGYFSSFDYVNLSAQDFIFFILLFLAAPATIVGIFSYKSITKKLTIKEMLTTYGCLFLGVSLLSISAFHVYGVICSAASAGISGSQSVTPVFLISIMIIAGVSLIFGILTIRKHPLLGLIGSAICAGGGLFAFIQTIGQMTIYIGSIYMTIDVYNIYYLTLFIFELLATALGIVLFLLMRKKKEPAPAPQTKENQ